MCPQAVCALAHPPWLQVWLTREVHVIIPTRRARLELCGVDTKALLKENLTNPGCRQKLQDLLDHPLEAYCRLHANEVVAPPCQAPATKRRRVEPTRGAGAGALSGEPQAPPAASAQEEAGPRDSPEVHAHAAAWEPVRVVEVDEHHHVLRCDVLKQALQDASGAVLVNFDSHDDLGVPPADPGLCSPDAEALLRAADVGTWIIPLIAHGAVSTLVWVTAYGNIPRNRSFEAHVVRDASGKLTVGGAAVPKVWRCLWGDDYSPNAAPPKSARGAKTGVTVHPFRVVVADAKDAAAMLSNEVQRARERSPGGTSPRFILSVDIDFFSTRNPAQRSLPFADHPTFAMAIWRLARAVPIVNGDAFHQALLLLCSPEEDRHMLTQRIAKLACGTEYEQRPTLDEVVSTVHASVERFAKLTAAQRQHALAALLRAHLADHQSTELELKQLMDLFEQAAKVVMAQPGAAREVVLARSEMYTTKRQANDIRLTALDILNVL